MMDSELIKQLKKQDPAGLEAAIDRYSGYVMAVVHHTLGNKTPEEDKEELVSDAFVALWKNAAKLKKDGRLKPWLAVVARNMALNRLRVFRPTEELREDHASTGADDVLAVVEREEQAGAIQQALDELSEEDRLIFRKYYYGHQKIPEIAKETGLKESTIKSRLHRGRKTLKTMLMSEGCTQ